MYVRHGNVSVDVVACECLHKPLFAPLYGREV